MGISSLVLGIVLSSLLGTLPEIAFAGDVACQFKAMETTEIHVLADGKTLWAGSIETQQTKTVSVPEGPFTVISKVYNQNLNAKEDIRAEAHTRHVETLRRSMSRFSRPQGAVGRHPLQETTGSAFPISVK